MDITAFLLSIGGITTNSFALSYILAAFEHGRKQHNTTWFSLMKNSLDLTACIFLLIESWGHSLSTTPSTVSQLFCVLHTVHFWFWVTMTLRVGLNVIQAGYYFEWLVLSKYHIVRLIPLQMTVVATAYGCQAVLSAILHGMQAEHRKGETRCSNALFLEDKFEDSTGLLKIAVVVHFVSFLTLPLVLVRYCYKVCLLGLADNDGIADRVAYGELVKLYYFDYMMFAFMTVPHLSGFFLYHFTPAFDFSPSTFSYRVTFYLFALYPTIYPLFSMHLLRIFRNPLSYSKDETKAEDEAKRES